MSYRKRQIIGFGTVLLLLLLAFGITMTLVANTVRNTDNKTSERLANVSLANEFKETFYVIDSELGYLVNPNQSGDTQERLANFERHYQAGQDQLDNLGDLAAEDDSKDLLHAIEQQYGTYLAIVGQVIEAIGNDDNSTATSLLAADAQLSRSSLVIHLDQFITYQDYQMAETQEQTRELFEWLWFIIGCVVLVILILSALISIWVVRGTTNSLKRVTDTITRVDFANAEQLPRLHMDTGDEINNIADAFNNMADALETHNRQVRELREHQEEQYFIQTTLAEAAHLYQGVEDMAVLGEAFLRLIAPKISAMQAAMYLRKHNNGESVLTRVATYAVVPKDQHIESFRMGEGVVGQVAVEKRRVVLGDLPAGYLIASGLGQAQPASVLIQPVVFENQIEAVIEFAALEPFLPRHEKLLDLLCHTFGIAVNSVRSRTEVDRLLQQSQQLTEELQTQAEELTTQQERMQAVNDQLAMQNRESLQKSTELELTSRELERYAAELEQATRYKTEFLANMSHELRTPLNSILILSQMMSENRSGKYDEEDADYAGIIQRAGEDLLLLIDDILDLSKIEAGMIDVITEPVVVAELPEMLRESFGNIALSKGIDLDIELTDEVPLTIYTDGKRLNQILKNLVSNAIKFTGKGKVHVLLSLADKEQDDCPEELKHADEVLNFRVQDTGIGIAQEKQEMIFQAFEQADETTSRKYGGTGLGLSICREFSRLLGGNIHVQSTPGEGSVFTLYLPSRSNRPEETGQSIVSEVSLAKEGESIAPGFKPEEYTILIVDDDDRNMYSLQEYLEDQGLNVLIAWNGQDALEVLNRHDSVHLVLMDLMMPIMDGYEAIREIRRDTRLRDLPIIAMTAKAMKTDRDECVAAGASDYISKPLHMKQLMSLIHVWTTCSEG